MSTKPKRIRSGAISASIFRNTFQVEGEERVSSNIRLERSYKDKNENWQTQHIDLPARQLNRALVVLEEAQSQVFLDEEKPVTRRRRRDEDRDR